MNDIDYMLGVMQAYKDGAAIQYRRRACKDDDWYETSPPTWNWDVTEYRVKPKEGVVYVVLLNKYADQGNGGYTNTIVFTGSMSKNQPGVYKDRATAEAKAEEVRRINPSPALVYSVVEVELIE